MLARLNIIVFGLDRCPNLCRPTLETFLSQLGERLDIYIGIISLEKEDGKCSNEQAILEEWISNLKLRRPLWHVKYFQIFLQSYPSLYSSSSLLDDSLKHCMKRLDIFYNGYASICNYMNYLYFSRCFASGLVDSIGDHPTLLLRPDMQYECLALDNVSTFKNSLKVCQRAACVISHDSYGYVNDRFIASSAQIVLAFMQRIDYLESYLQLPWRYFHSEQFASWFLRRRLMLRIDALPLSFCGKRVRANGIILEDSNLSIYDTDKKRFKPMFRRHTYWQMKLSAKNWLNSLRS